MSTQGDVIAHGHERVAPRRGEIPARRILIAAWLLLVLAAVALNARASDLADLERWLGTAGPHDVTVIGPGLPAGVDGGVVQQVRWRQGFQNRIATVVVTIPVMSGGLEPAVTGPDVPRVRARDLGDYLAGRHPDAGLTVDRIRSDQTVTAFGRTVALPVWATTPPKHWPPIAVPSGVLTVPFLLVQVATLGLLIRTREPWRATQWAWFWLWLTPIGVPAFLLLGGPGGPVRAPREGARRLTGGWAFLLAAAITSASTAG